MTIKMRLAAALIISLSTMLTGCAAFMQGWEDGRENARRRDQAAQEEKQAALRERLDQRCIGYGFKPGTDAFAACRQNETNNIEQQSLQRRAAQTQPQLCTDKWGSIIPCSMANSGQSTTTTTCRNFGGTVTCETAR